MNHLHLRLFLLLVFALPTPALAQTHPLCQTSPPFIQLYDTTPARESFPIVTRNTFIDGTGPELLDVSVHLPGTLTPDCPFGSIEPMRGIRDLGDGLFEGYVVHNSLSHHSHLFGQTFTFTTDQVWDWQLITPASEGRFYGNFRGRDFVTWAPDGGGVMITLMPDPLPPDWN